MAIKISGTVVIDDSRNLTANTVTANTFTGNGTNISTTAFNTTLRPTNLSPADGATDVSSTPTLQISGFQSTVGGTHANTQFQVSIVSDFANTEVNVTTGANTTLVVPSELSFETEHFFRARYIDNNGCCSAFSTPTSFTTELASAEFEGASFGGSAGGGFYMGTICAVSSCYYLVMAPNATGCAGCQWKTTRTDSGVGATGDEALCDGYGNTYDHLANATHPAGNWAATRSIGGYSDWYLPAKCELALLYTNINCAPAGEGFALGTPGCYWSSTEDTISDACAQNFDYGSIGDAPKNATCCVRAVRRVPF